MADRMVACVGCTAIAQTILALFGFIYLARLDWSEAAALVKKRANTDKLQQIQDRSESERPADSLRDSLMEGV